ncbi:MAG: rRNA pseudouridine synthase [Clostridia bacterium]|nr:rRNA pseudouridine synthase [Clostridia bacterium]
MEPIRLQKFFTDCDILSRRAAEEEIQNGKVFVNGMRAELGQKIDPETDVVEYKGKVIEPPKKTIYKYVMLNKPRGYLSTVTDDRGRACVTELVKDAGARLYPVGRLDMDSEGLLLMTNDGALTYKLTHPKHDIPKIYHVKIEGKVSAEQLRALASPMVIDGYKILPVKTETVTAKNEYTVLRMTLYEGRNRQIRKMCEAQNLHILRLCRVAIGELELGNLAPGRWRYLTKSQVEYLKKGKGK